MRKSKGKHFKSSTRWTPNDVIDFLLIAAIVLCIMCIFAFVITTIADGAVNRLACLAVAISATFLAGIQAVQARRNHTPIKFACIPLIATVVFAAIAAFA